MTTFLNKVVRLYAILLRLYPKTFREEHGEEMLAVFNLIATEAGERRPANLLIVIFRELLALPGSAILEHMRARQMEEVMRGLRFLRSSSRFALLGAVGFAVAYVFINRATNIVYGMSGLGAAFAGHEPGANLLFLFYMISIGVYSLAGALVGVLLTPGSRRGALARSALAGGLGLALGQLMVSLVTGPFLNRFVLDRPLGEATLASLGLLLALIHGAVTGAVFGGVFVAVQPGLKPNLRLVLAGAAGIGAGSLLSAIVYTFIGFTAIGQAVLVPPWPDAPVDWAFTRLPLWEGQVQVMTNLAGGLLAGCIFGWAWGRTLEHGETFLPNPPYTPSTS